METKGVLFSIDESYKVTCENVIEFDPGRLSDTDYFMPQTEVMSNEYGYLRDGEHIVIAKMRRKKVVQDLQNIGYEVGCPTPENAWYIVAGQPNASDYPPSVYYEISHTFEDMDWEFNGCPHAQE